MDKALVLTLVDKCLSRLRKILPNITREMYPFGVAKNIKANLQPVIFINSNFSYSNHNLSSNTSQDCRKSFCTNAFPQTTLSRFAHKICNLNSLRPSLIWGRTAGVKGGVIVRIWRRILFITSSNPTEWK